MKQVNLLPKSSIEETLFFIHPFWKNYFKVSILVIVLSLSFPFLFHGIESRNNRELEYLTEYSKNLQTNKEWFNKLLEEQRRLEEEVAAIQNNSNDENLHKIQFAPGILPNLKKIIGVLPDSVWLQDIDCNNNARSIHFTGYSPHKDQIQKFLNEDLMQISVFQDITVHHLRRLEERNLYQFYASIQFNFQ